MDVSLSFLLILPLIAGSESVQTISKVSVKAGASVSIPCFYDGIYKNHVKYLCKGYYFNQCLLAIRTDSSQETDKYSISEDKTQNILNMTIKKLTADDTDYWCGVEIHNGADIKLVYFQLSVTSDEPILSVADQNVIGYIEDKIAISCSFRNSGGVRWCKLGRACVTKTNLPGNIDGTAVTINTAISKVINVTMSGLKPESSGWYYCVKGDFQMPVHLTVTVKPTVAATTTVATTTVAATTTVTKPGENAKVHKGNRDIYLRILAIPLSVLIFIVIVALAILFVLRGTKRVKIKDSTAPKNEGDLTYAEVSFKKNKAAQAASDADVTYSSVVPVKKQSARRSEEKDEDVTYSTVIHHKQNV